MNLELPNHLGGTVTNQPQSRYILPEFRERSANGERVHNPTRSCLKSASSSWVFRLMMRARTTSWLSCCYLESMDPDRDISIYINSPGGSYTAMTAIYDTMQFVKPEVQTVCLGQAASAAAVLLAAGSPGKRSRCRTRGF